jgi:hypothetical protein
MVMIVDCAIIIVSLPHDRTDCKCAPASSTYAAERHQRHAYATCLPSSELALPGSLGNCCTRSASTTSSLNDRQRYVLGRIRAGVLEQVTMDLLSRAGVDVRAWKKAAVLRVNAVWAPANRPARPDRRKAGHGVRQTEVTRDLMAQDARRPQTFGRALQSACTTDSARPSRSLRKDGDARIEARIAGCDGYG